MGMIPVIVALPDAHEDKEVKGFFSSELDIGMCEISTDVLRENLSKVCQDVAEILKDIKKIGDFKLKEVEIQVEVNAEGGVELIGTAKLGGKGAIILKFAE